MERSRCGAHTYTETEATKKEKTPRTHGEEERQKEKQKERERDSCWLINNACFIQNQLGLSTQNMFCIMKSLATSPVQQRRYGRPKNPLIIDPHPVTTRQTGEQCVLHGAAADLDDFSAASLAAGHENVICLII